jgi:hypothetical protein
VTLAVAAASLAGVDAVWALWLARALLRLQDDVDALERDLERVAESRHAK